MLKGIATASGIALGKVFKYEQPIINIVEGHGDPCEELAKFDAALNKTKEDINKVKQRASKNLKPEELAIFDAHLMMADDPELICQIKEMINGGYTADYSCKYVSDNTVAIFESMDDPYFKERAADMRDVSFRLICNLLDIVVPDLTAIEEESIIVANELTPSDTAQLNTDLVLGFCTEIGGRTSHSAIMAVSLGIPAVVGTTGILQNARHGDFIIVDSLDGNVIVNPREDEIQKYEAKRNEYLKEKEALKILIDKETITIDNRKVDVASNIGTPQDVKSVIENGAEGIGLFRTEFLYMDKTDGFPSEDEQFEAYKMVLEKTNGKRVVVRTLDIGGDKTLNYFKFPQEMNPFLGYRAIRLCLDRKDIFKTQIRALLKASVYGKLAIMFPMIATINEFKEAKEFVLTTKEELIKEGIKVSDSIEIGMMVEIPAAAVLADEFSKYADFFSIGTNDLIQYSMAADRMSEKVSYLYQPLNPSILRLAKMAIDGAHANGKWCGMCGEMAGDLLAAPILLGLGLDEFSVSASKVLPTRKMLNNLSYKDMKELADKAIKLHTCEEVTKLVKETVK